jgi:hypothetical protein
MKDKIKLLSVKPLKSGNKKYEAKFEIKKSNGKTRNKTIKFGAKGMSDFTIHKDTERRDRYISRHKKDLRTNDPTRAGYLSMYILWNKKTFKASLADYKRRLNTYNRTGKFPIAISGSALKSKFGGKKVTFKDEPMIKFYEIEGELKKRKYPNQRIRQTPIKSKIIYISEFNQLSLDFAKFLGDYHNKSLFLNSNLSCLLYIFKTFFRRDKKIIDKNEFIQYYNSYFIADERLKDESCIRDKGILITTLFNTDQGKNMIKQFNDFVERKIKLRKKMHEMKFGGQIPWENTTLDRLPIDIKTQIEQELNASIIQNYYTRINSKEGLIDLLKLRAYTTYINSGRNRNNIKFIKKLYLNLDPLNQFTANWYSKASIYLNKKDIDFKTKNLWWKIIENTLESLVEITENGEINPEDEDDYLNEQQKKNYMITRINLIKILHKVGYNVNDEENWYWFANALNWWRQKTTNNFGKNFDELPNELRQMIFEFRKNKLKEEQEKRKIEKEKQKMIDYLNSIQNPDYFNIPDINDIINNFGKYKVPDNVKNKSLYLRIKNKIGKEVKKKGRRWGAYDSGRLVREYKEKGGKYSGKKSTKTKSKKSSNLDRWYREKWIDACVWPKRKSCGRTKASIKSKVTYCRPSKVIDRNTPKTIQELTKAEIKRKCAKKSKNPKKIVR